MNSSSEKRRTYSVAAAAQILGVGRTTLYRAVREGRADHLRPIHIGGTVRLPARIVDALAEGVAA